MITAAVVVGASTAYSANQNKKAARSAQDSQEQMAEKQLAEQKAQFEAMNELLAPYVEAGTPALKQMAGYSDIGPMAINKQKALSGLNGYKAQQKAISEIEKSPLLQAQMKQGEEAMLQNASATGGLRGGNTQAALAQFRPQMLQQAIDQQYAKLGGLANFGAGMTQNLAQTGQASAAGQGVQGMQQAQNLGGIYNQMGINQGNYILAQNSANNQMVSGIAGGIGTIAGIYNQSGGFGGGSSPVDQNRWY